MKYRWSIGQRFLIRWCRWFTYKPRDLPKFSFYRGRYGELLAGLSTAGHRPFVRIQTRNPDASDAGSRFARLRKGSRILWFLFLFSAVFAVLSPAMAPSAMGMLVFVAVLWFALLWLSTWDRDTVECLECLHEARRTRFGAKLRGPLVASDRCEAA